MIPQRVLDRVDRHIDRRGPDDCWPWTGSVGTHGYGQIGWWVGAEGKSHNALAHRVAWVLARGPIPDGLHIDHLCNNKVCCNPAHMEPVTNAENVRRRHTRDHPPSPQCPAGHDFTPENLYVDRQGWRRCRECARESTRGWLARRRAKANA